MAQFRERWNAWSRRRKTGDCGLIETRPLIEMQSSEATESVEIRKLGQRQSKAVNGEHLQRLRDRARCEAFQRRELPSSTQVETFDSELGEQKGPVCRVEPAAEAQLGDAATQLKGSEQSIGGDEPVTTTGIVAIQSELRKLRQLRQKGNLRDPPSVKEMKCGERRQPDEQLSSAHIAIHASDLLPLCGDGRLQQTRKHIGRDPHDLDALQMSERRTNLIDLGVGELGRVSTWATESKVGKRSTSCEEAQLEGRVRFDR